MRIMIAAALLACAQVGCAHGQSIAHPTQSRPLVVAVFEVFGPIDEREIFIHPSTLDRIELTLPSEPHDADAIGRALGERVRTDVQTVDFVCRARTRCRLPGNPLILTIDSLSIDGNEAQLRARVVFNVNQGDVTRIAEVTKDMRLQRQGSGWVVLSTSQPWVH